MPALYETIEPDLPHCRRLPPEHGTVGTDTKTLADVLGRKPALRDLLNRLKTEFLSELAPPVGEVQLTYVRLLQELGAMFSLVSTVKASYSGGTMMDIPFLQTAGGRIQCSRCQAKNRAGNQCAKPAIRGKRVCRNHGGRSTGSTTPKGLARIKEAATKHGKFSKEGLARATAQSARIRELEDALIVLGAIPEGQRTRGPKPAGYEPLITMADVRKWASTIAGK